MSGSKLFGLVGFAALATICQPALAGESGWQMVMNKYVRESTCGQSSTSHNSFVKFDVKASEHALDSASTVVLTDTSNRIRVRASLVEDGRSYVLRNLFGQAEHKSPLKRRCTDGDCTFSFTYFVNEYLPIHSESSDIHITLLDNSGKALDDTRFEKVSLPNKMSSTGWRYPPLLWRIDVAEGVVFAVSDVGVSNVHEPGITMTWSDGREKKAHSSELLPTPQEKDGRLVRYLRIGEKGISEAALNVTYSPAQNLLVENNVVVYDARDPLLACNFGKGNF